VPLKSGKTIVPDPNAIRFIGDALERAYTELLRLGYAVEPATQWPLYVDFVDYGAKGAHALAERSKSGLPFSRIHFNSHSLGAIASGDAAARREVWISAAHELFHVVQYYYTGSLLRNWEFNWLLEATSTWLESRFAPRGYLPGKYPENRFVCLHGLAPAAGSDLAATRQHGYGMAPLIFHIEREKGVEGVRRLWEGIQRGEAPIVALRGVLGDDTRTWWHVFIAQQAAGTYYGNETPAWSSSWFRAGDLVVDRLEGLKHTFDTPESTSYRNYTAKTFRVLLGKRRGSGGITGDVALTPGRLEISLDRKDNRLGNGPPMIHVFRYLGGQKTLLASGVGPLEIPNVHRLAGSTLGIVVSFASVDPADAAGRHFTTIPLTIVGKPEQEREPIVGLWSRAHVVGKGSRAKVAGTIQGDRELTIDVARVPGTDPPLYEGRIVSYGKWYGPQHYKERLLREHLYDRGEAFIRFEAIPGTENKYGPRFKVEQKSPPVNRKRPRRLPGHRDHWRYKGRTRVAIQPEIGKLKLGGGIQPWVRP